MPSGSCVGGVPRSLPSALPPAAYAWLSRFVRASRTAGAHAARRKSRPAPPPGLAAAEQGASPPPSIFLCSGRGEWSKFAPGCIASEGAALIRSSQREHAPPVSPRRWTEHQPPGCIFQGRKREGGGTGRREKDEMTAAVPASAGRVDGSRWCPGREPLRLPGIPRAPFPGWVRSRRARRAERAGRRADLQGALQHRVPPPPPPPDAVLPADCPAAPSRPGLSGELGTRPGLEPCPTGRGVAVCVSPAHRAEGARGGWSSLPGVDAKRARNDVSPEPNPPRSLCRGGIHP
ncbi:uncharacterized protein LJ264_001144 [Porphyrio hochstetteri]